MSEHFQIHSIGIKLEKYYSGPSPSEGADKYFFDKIFLKEFCNKFNETPSGKSWTSQLLFA